MYPAGHGMGSMVPSSVHECPAGQRMHCVVAIVAEYDPGVHGTCVICIQLCCYFLSIIFSYFYSIILLFSYFIFVIFIQLFYFYLGGILIFLECRV